VTGDAPAGEPASAGARRPPLGTAYWRLWTSAGLSSLADGIVKVGLPLVALRYTRSPALIAGLPFAFTLPWLVCALPAGALVDRVDRRRAMLAADTFRAALLAALSLAAAVHGGSIWVLYVIALGAGTAETIYDTAAQSIVPQLVGRTVLARANGHIYAAELTGNEFAGPPLAGLLVGAGVLAAVATPMALWLVAVGALLLIRGSFRIPRDGPATMRADIAEGLRFLWRQRILRTFTVMVGVFNFATSGAFAILVLYAVGAQSPMGLSESGYGLLLATVAAGSVAGSLVAPQVERVLGRARSLGAAIAGGALLVGIPAVTANPYVMGGAFIVGGAGVLISNIIMVSLRQQITPDRLLGRVSSANRFVAWGTMPLGAAAGGGLAQLLGLRAVFAIMSLLVLAVLAGLLIVTDDAMDAAERGATDPGAADPGAADPGAAEPGAA
jgi:MFS family permease